MNRDSFIFHREWYDAIKELDDCVRYEIYDAIVAEAFELETKQLSPLAQMAMKFIRQRLSNDKEKYEAICRRNSANGSKGGRPKKTEENPNNPENPVGILETEENPNNPENPKKADTDIDTDIDIHDTNVSMSIKEEDSKESKKKKFVYPQEYENDFILYGRKGSKKNGYNRWKDLTDDEKEKMRKHIPYYLQSNDRQYLKDFEGYINQRLFESPVYKGSELLFDPMQSESSGVYCPKTDGVFQWWDDKEKCLNFNGYLDMVDDGYTNDNRPNGAKLKWQMYYWIWSATTKEWVKQQ